MLRPRLRPAARRQRSRLRVGAVAAGLAAVLLAGAVPVPAAAVTPDDQAEAATFPGGVVTLTGRGWGHGRGLSQWGSLGYAIDEGWSYTQILDHYYGGTTMGSVDPATTVHVRLVGHDDEPTIVFQQQSLMVTNADGGVGRYEALRAVPLGDGTYEVASAVLPGDGEPSLGACADPDALAWTPVVATPVPGPVNFASLAPGTEDRTQVLQVCQLDDQNVRYYRGDLQAVRSGATSMTRNIVPLDAYLRGVVPRESPASWGALDGGEGMHALRAQAVAARSYAAAERRPYLLDAPGPRTCDTTACQVYWGVGEWRAGGWTQLEHPLTDQAVAETSGQVRLWSDGALALTEFSSSTGGFTAPGTPRTVGGTTFQFPAVPDAGDDVCRAGQATACNPRHSWRAEVPVSAIQAAYPQVGALAAVDIPRRSGGGDLGGRADSVILRGSGGSVTITGEQFRSAFSSFGVFSRWFAVIGGGTYAGGAVNPQSTGYWLTTPQGEVLRYGTAPLLGDLAGVPLSRPIVGMESTASGAGYWLVASDGGIFAFGDAEFYGSTGAMTLNRPIVGMARTPSGRGYWLVASDGGIFAFGDAAFHGSTGGMVINRPVVGMEPSAAGYWLVASDGGIFAFGDAAFHGSTGAIALNRPVVGMSSTRGWSGYTLIASDGGTFNFGDAEYLGSLPGLGVSATAVSLSHIPSGGGYYVFTTSGGVFAFGDAPSLTAAVGVG